MWHIFRQPYLYACKTKNKFFWPFKHQHTSFFYRNWCPKEHYIVVFHWSQDVLNTRSKKKCNGILKEIDGTLKKKLQLTNYEESMNYDHMNSSVSRFFKNKILFMKFVKQSSKFKQIFISTNKMNDIQFF
jgi:hypothetical protein